MSELTKEQIDSVYEVIEVAKATGKIKKGTNEATKALEKGTAKLVAYAADITPAEVTMHIPLLAKEKGILCFAVPSKEELGTAAGIGVSTAAVAVTDEGTAKKQLAALLKDNEPAPVVEEKVEEATEEAKEEVVAETKEEATPEVKEEVKEETTEEATEEAKSE